ncbi:MAG: peptide chain release factor N(5)-glutamine methyltransferase [bacterium]|nr:peptide chain release factor N(5)-glutamine methyltransferase [bacterium]
MRSKEEQWILEEKYKGKECPEFFRDLERLRLGEHVDTIIGFRDFLGCAIGLEHRPLIPREETENWAGKAIQEVGDKNVLCLDMFAGSGCIGIALLKHCANACVVFAEKEERLLLQIKKNAERNNILPKRYSIIRSDIFSNIKGTFDIIVTNPPYVAESARHLVQESVLRSDPHEALFAGQDGMDIICPFLQEAKQFLNPKGIIFMEFGEDQKKEIERLSLNLGYEGVFFKDQFGKWRWCKLAMQNIVPMVT